MRSSYPIRPLLLSSICGHSLGLVYSREIMEIAMRRVTSPKTSASDRIKWSRITIAAGQACNAVLRDVEIDALKQQINELIQLTLAKVGEDEESDANENQRDQTGSQQTQTND